MSTYKEGRGMRGRDGIFPRYTAPPLYPRRPRAVRECYADDNDTTFIKLESGKIPVITQEVELKPSRSIISGVVRARSVVTVIVLMPVVAPTMEGAPPDVVEVLTTQRLAVERLVRMMRFRQPCTGA
jgi:hypothetical protein